jgi:phosphoribosylformylglycinamidine cyclo-ligase
MARHSVHQLEGGYRLPPTGLQRGLGAKLSIPFWENDVVQKVLRHADKSDAIDTFNMGLGWVAIVSPDQVDKALASSPGAKIIGEMDSSAQVSVEIV